MIRSTSSGLKLGGGTTCSALTTMPGINSTELANPLALYNLNPFERRIVHVALSENKEVVTESQGEGKNRFLVVSPKE